MCELDVSLEELMQRYQAADAAATDMLVQQISPGLMRFFIAQEATRSEAGDLLQETWLRVHRVRHTYRFPAPVLPWVYSIARHVRVDGYRKSSRIRRHETAVDVLPDPPSRSPESRSEVPTFESLMAFLPESQREVVTLMIVNGLTLEEVARATSATVGSVKQKANRAYTKLRSILESAALS